MQKDISLEENDGRLETADPVKIGNTEVNLFVMGAITILSNQRLDSVANRIGIMIFRAKNFFKNLN